jgi:hypothetical protein
MKIEYATVLVIDHGTFLPFAQKLAEQAKRVLYHTPLPNAGCPAFRDYLPGKGIPGIERCDDFWPMLDQVDLICFPDIGNAGLQIKLSEMGFPVWGSKGADKLETLRFRLLKIMDELGMDLPEYVVVDGLSDLRAYLKEHNDLFVKVSKIRRDFETFHHLDYAMSEPRLDQLAATLGPLQNTIPFLVMKPVDGIEDAIDTFAIDGQFPSLAVHGIEIKDAGYVGAVQKHSEMPQELQDIYGKLSPFLADEMARNFFASEVRIGERAVLIDVSARHTSPAGETLLELYDNWPQIVMAGAQGTLIEPEPKAMYGVQLMISHTGDREFWRTLKIPDKLRPAVKLYCASELDGLTVIPPSTNACDIIGSVVSVADSWEEAIGQLKDYMEELGDQPVKGNIQALGQGLAEMQEAEDQKMKFGDDEIPDPEIVV